MESFSEESEEVFTNTIFYASTLFCSILHYNHRSHHNMKIFYSVSSGGETKFGMWGARQKKYRRGMNAHIMLFFVNL